MVDPADSLIEMARMTRASATTGTGTTKANDETTCSTRSLARYCRTAAYTPSATPITVMRTVAPMTSCKLVHARNAI